SLTQLFIGKTFVVAPDESILTSDRPHRLVIPQAQAFGTGSHESTALCIELLEDLDLAGKRGLDIGCGSGILSFAMLRLGASKVVAFDVDPDVIGPVRENQRRNALDVSFFVGTLDAITGVFDVITMNILPAVIVPMLPKVRNHLAGVLIVSGVLAEQREEIVSHMRVVEERTKGEWWAATL